MEIRFSRVQLFVDYLRREEDAEHAAKDLVSLGGVIGERIVPDIAAAVQRQVDWIGQRVRQNRERIKDDVVIVGSDVEEDVLELDDDEPTASTPGGA